MEASLNLAVVVGVAIGLLLGSPVESQADTIWIEGESSPIFGLVESSDETSITFNQTSDGSSFKLVTIPKERIGSIVVNVDAKRLSSLVHGDWRPWHDYAEELLSQKKDPVARTLAMRLLAIVSGNTKDPIQKSAAINDLITLAKDDLQREDLLKIRYLETGQNPPEKQLANSIDIPNTESREAAAKLVRSIRKGIDVSSQLANEELKKTISAFSQVCTWQELVQLAKANRITDEGLRRLVALEVELRTADANPNTTNNSQVSWHLQANRISTKKLALPTLRSATGFDPEHNRFIDGRWQK